MTGIARSIQIQREPGILYVLSYSGGVDSTAMYVLVKQGVLPVDHIVFADTGDERKETYSYIDYIKRMFENDGIPFHILKTKSGRSLFDRCIARFVVPSKLWRWCTRDMKIRPIYAFYRSLGLPVIQYIGFDGNEKKRVKANKDPMVTNCFPLYDRKISREECQEMIKSAGLLVPTKSSCKFCPFQSTEQWVHLYWNDREGFYEAMCMEEQNKYFPRQRLFIIPLRELEQLILAGKPLPKSRANDNCGSL